MDEEKPDKTPSLLSAQRHVARCSPPQSLVQQLLKPAPTTMLGETISSGLLAGGHQESLRHRLLSLAGCFRGGLYMLGLFSPLRSTFAHFQTWDTKLDRALVQPSITTLCSHPAHVQDPYFLRRSTTEEQNKSFILCMSGRG